MHHLFHRFASDSGCLISLSLVEAGNRHKWGNTRERSVPVSSEGLAEG